MRFLDKIDMFYYLLVNRMRDSDIKITQRSGTIFFDVIE